MEKIAVKFTNYIIPRFIHIYLYSKINAKQCTVRSLIKMLIHIVFIALCNIKEATKISLITFIYAVAKKFYLVRARSIIRSSCGHKFLLPVQENGY